jgi:hypothetical protein
MNAEYVVSFRIPSALKDRIEANPREDCKSANQTLRVVALEQLAAVGITYDPAAPEPEPVFSPEVQAAQAAGYAMVASIDQDIRSGYAGFEDAYEAAYAKIIRDIQGV